ncbi:SymE family type I addiction module toxin [Enterocloster sp. OA13]|uniref:SymE family type I addiction module toxin n=1 Tax=Enterocloster sp. OA13 TaxID=2914161 RepID=UPI00047136A2|nr:SymE family type I addiction module toxin [Enterocloster sp. OA13]
MQDKETEKYMRRLKIYGVRDGQGTLAPQLRLQGKWLEDCGFLPGSYIEVSCSEETLVIRKAKTVRVLVAGSRSITAFDLSPYIPSDCGLIISGGAKGVDALAEQYALAHGIETMILKPDYERFGRGAPLKRNEIMVQQADSVLAIWDGKSRGTKYTIEYAKKQGKPVQVITLTDEKQP